MDICFNTTLLSSEFTFQFFLQQTFSKVLCRSFKLLQLTFQRHFVIMVLKQTAFLALEMLFRTTLMLQHFFTFSVIKFFKSVSMDANNLVATFSVNSANGICLFGACS